LLFIYLIVALMVATAILSALNVGVQNPTDGSRVVVKNLLSVEGCTGFCRTSLRTSAVSRRWGHSGAGAGGRICGTRGPAAFADGENVSHVSARYASYMVLFIAFFSHISPMPRW
jgi:aminobenzoyl-glutamate transport protein